MSEQNASIPRNSKEELVLSQNEFKEWHYLDTHSLDSCSLDSRSAMREVRPEHSGPRPFLGQTQTWRQREIKNKFGMADPPGAGVQGGGPPALQSSSIIIDFLNFYVSR
jgi:hypothetical protein